MRDINELLKLPLEDLNDLELKEIDKFYAENVHFALTLDNSAIKKMIDTILKKLQISAINAK